MKPLASSHILTRIVEARKLRLSKAKTLIPDTIVRAMAQKADKDAPVPSFAQVLQGPGRVRIIAELKKASPSRGVLSENFSPSDLARTYAGNGAAAISVVTEEDFFQGSSAWVGQARKATALPVLRKDFVFDPYQIYETRAVGASAILLIAAMLTPDELRSMLAVARDAGLDALVEVHDEEELEEALAAGAAIIGVNNRDLKTFDVDVSISERLGKRIPDDRIFVVESGIRTAADIQRLLEYGADAFLVGETLISAGDPGAALRGLL